MAKISRAIVNRTAAKFSVLRCSTVIMKGGVAACEDDGASCPFVVRLHRSRTKKGTIFWAIDLKASELKHRNCVGYSNPGVMRGLFQPWREA